MKFEIESKYEIGDVVKTTNKTLGIVMAITAGMDSNNQMFISYKLDTGNLKMGEIKEENIVKKVGEDHSTQ
jgi:hypothetical protein